MPESVLTVAGNALEWLRKARKGDNNQRAKELGKLGQTLRDANSAGAVPPKGIIERI